MSTTFTLMDATRLAEQLGVVDEVDLEELSRGMAVELEHGRRDPLTNVTDDDPLLTAKIALAHLRELPDYYSRLAQMEAAGERRLRVGDLMTIDPVVIALDAPIEEAERLILDRRVSGLPVIDRTGALVGVVSQTDFMHLGNPDVQGLIHHKSSGIRVGEVMSRPPVTVLVSTSLVEAARSMVTERVHRVVVVDDEQRPIGVLAAMDFVTLFAEGATVGP